MIRSVRNAMPGLQRGHEEAVDGPRREKKNLHRHRKSKSHEDPQLMLTTPPFDSEPSIREAQATHNGSEMQRPISGHLKVND